MVESIWTSAAVGLNGPVPIGWALVRAVDAILLASAPVGVGLCAAVLSPGLDGKAARAALSARLPQVPVLVLQAEGPLGGGERVRHGAAVLIGQWPGDPAVLRRLPSVRALPTGPGPGWLFAEACSPALELALARTRGRVWGATAAGLLEPMGSPAAVWLELPPSFSMELRFALGALPIGRRLRAGGVSDGQIGMLDGVPAARALSSLGAELPRADRERLRLRPLLLRADGPAWAVGGLGRPMRVLGVHESSSHLLLQGDVRAGASVQLGAAQTPSLSAGWARRPLDTAGLRLGLLVHAAAGPAPEGLPDAELAAVLAALGPSPLFGFSAERQLFGREGRSAAFFGSTLLGALHEPPYD